MSSRPTMASRFLALARTNANSRRMGVPAPGGLALSLLQVYRHLRRDWRLTARGEVARAEIDVKRVGHPETMPPERWEGWERRLLLATAADGPRLVDGTLRPDQIATAFRRLAHEHAHLRVRGLEISTKTRRAISSEVVGPIEATTVCPSPRSRSTVPPTCRLTTSSRYAAA
jgi:hypothetical protein